MNWLMNRLNERSTWLGIFAGLSLLGMKLQPEFRELLINAVLGVAAIVAFVYRENKNERSTDQPTEYTGPQQALPPIELVGQAESPAQHPDPAPPFVSGADPLRNRCVTDAWVRESMPSESDFKIPVQPNRGTVGWNEDN